MVPKRIFFYKHKFFSYSFLMVYTNTNTHVWFWHEWWAPRAIIEFISCYLCRIFNIQFMYFFLPSTHLPITLKCYTNEWTWNEFNGEKKSFTQPNIWLSFCFFFHWNGKEFRYLYLYRLIHIFNFIKILWDADDNIEKNWIIFSMLFNKSQSNNNDDPKIGFEIKIRQSSFIQFFCQSLFFFFFTHS